MAVQPRFPFPKTTTCQTNFCGIISNEILHNRLFPCIFADRNTAAIEFCGAKQTILSHNETVQILDGRDAVHAHGRKRKRRPTQHREGRQSCGGIRHLLDQSHPRPAFHDTHQLCLRTGKQDFRRHPHQQPRTSAPDYRAQERCAPAAGHALCGRMGSRWIQRDGCFGRPSQGFRPRLSACCGGIQPGRHRHRLGIPHPEQRRYFLLSTGHRQLHPAHARPPQDAGKQAAAHHRHGGKRRVY